MAFSKPARGVIGTMAGARHTRPHSSGAGSKIWVAMPRDRMTEQIPIKGCLVRRQQRLQVIHDLLNDLGQFKGRKIIINDLTWTSIGFFFELI
jgi:hypothetical protein